jgi:hypothetical protein
MGLFWRLETRNPKPEPRNPKPETLNPKPETLEAESGTRWSHKPETYTLTLNPKPATRQILNPKP